MYYVPSTNRQPVTDWLTHSPHDAELACPDKQIHRRLLLLPRGDLRAIITLLIATSGNTTGHYSKPGTYPESCLSQLPSSAEQRWWLAVWSGGHSDGPVRARRWKTSKRNEEAREEEAWRGIEMSRQTTRTPVGRPRCRAN